jgi:hypothetical protein
MITTLDTIKTRLGLDPAEIRYDALLNAAANAVTARFDQECNRSLARTVNITHEFNAEAVEIPVACYPIESVSRFDVKSSETEGWVEVTGVKYLLRKNCVISLAAALGSWRQLGRVTYTGGYVLPGATVGAGQVGLPADLEQAAVEQIAFWFQNRDKLGLIRHRPNQGTYEQFAQIDFLPSVAAILRRYERWTGF